MASTGNQGSIEAAKRVKEILDSDAFLNEELPGLLASLVAALDQASESRDTRHYEPHDNLNDLAEITRRLLSALEKYLSKYAPPATPDGSDDHTNQLKKLKELTETFGKSLEVIVDSKE